MDAPQGPSTKPFSFVFIPSADTKSPELQRYEGNSDEELKQILRAYFARVGGGLNEDQKNELHKSLQARLEEAEKKQKQKDGANGAAAAAAAATTGAPAASSSRVEVIDDDHDDNSVKKKDESSAQQQQGKEEDKSKLTLDLLSHAVNSQEDGAFEIVPVVMPGPSNKFVGTSLYIDQTGAFKDLPMNCRASRLVNREVRGDAFLLSNHDDPALDNWERVDTTLADFERLHSNPAAQQQHDLSTQSGNSAAVAQMQNYTKTVSAEDAAAALKALDDGRAAFAKQQFDAAAKRFASCSALLNARTDLLPNDEELQKAKTLAVLNGSMCALKTQQWGVAEMLAEHALQREPGNDKAAFRLCTARIKSNDFDGARPLIEMAKKKYADHPEDDPTAVAWKGLEQEFLAAQSAFESTQKAKYRGMFG